MTRVTESRIIVRGNVVHIQADERQRLDVPRRQSFAWPENAEAYAAELNVERGWKIEQATEISK